MQKIYHGNEEEKQRGNEKPQCRGFKSKEKDSLEESEPKLKTMRGKRNERCGHTTFDFGFAGIS